MAFALAMVSYPDVQRRAQAEIDSVIGKDRLPTFEDRASLPYVESVLRETLRWQPIGPLGDFPCRVILPSLKTKMILYRHTTC
jgi:cytochrome P450